ncbi:Urease accessory protein UreF [Mycolicibacterium vanbaalenii]|uniref:Urease accessory protein UreF n=1 Tax=Mycolicibacterium vanbaalenii TaxID=110539 RepID=A0A5S9R5W2_MYCVN|nr:urease accessory UreF family protein [Mycolicibacterium vanbaalenii]CAA0129252.1 Urease accessory protein UreF [Mycolicibacterium vanbaalenii]
MSAITTEPEVALLLWMQLQDSAFPAGRMVHSQGLEQWLAERPEAGDDEIAAVVTEFLTHCYAPLDATVTAAAWRAAPHHDSLCQLDDLLATYKLFDNARTASESAGRQLAAAARHTGIVGQSRYLDVVVEGTTPGHCAVVEGALQAALGIPVHHAVLGSIRSVMASMLSATVRLGRLGPLSSQRIQAGRASLVADLAHDACRRAIDDLWSVSPALEISGMRHETRTSRLFAT